MQQLEDPLRLQQIAQPVLAQIAQLGSGGQGAAGQLLDRLGQEDLATVPGGQEPGQPVERSGQVVAPLVRHRLPGMQRHAHPQRTEDRPSLLAASARWAATAARSGVLGGGEGGLHCHRRPS